MNILDILAELSNGLVLVQLEEAMTTISKGVKETGKPGKLTLTLDLKPLSKPGEDVKETWLLYKIKSDVPKHDNRKTLFYLNDDHSISRDNREQLVFDGIGAAGAQREEVKP